MSKVVLQGYIVVPESDLRLIESALATHIQLTKAEPGCLVFEITRDAENPCEYHVYEEFSDQKSFALHQQRVQASAWGRVTSNVERFYEVSRA